MLEASSVPRLVMCIAKSTNPAVVHFDSGALFVWQTACPGRPCRPVPQIYRISGKRVFVEWSCPTVSHRSDADATPVDFKLHHYQPRGVLGRKAFWRYSKYPGQETRDGNPSGIARRGEIQVFSLR